MSLFLDRRTQWAVLGDIMLLTPPTVSGQAAVLADSSADVRAIMAAGARSNAAIVSRDTAGVAREMMPDVTVVSSTSAMGTGVEVNVSRMAAQFARRPDTRWIRTPAAVAVSEARSARIFLESPLHERAYADRSAYGVRHHRPAITRIAT